MIALKSKYSPENYDTFVKDLLVGDPSVEYAVVALAEEVGEACGKIKRLYRGDYNVGGKLDQEKFQNDLGNELGDILYYLVHTGHCLGLNLDDLLQMNITKLLDRKERGKVLGSGDNR